MNRYKKTTNGSSLMIDHPEGDYVKYADIEPPEKLDKWLYAVLKEARRMSYTDFIDNWDISEDEDEAIMKWFETMTGKYPG